MMKIGIYPGTFDPITHGHTDIITRSLKVFDKVVVAVAPNPAKHPLFTLTERLEMIRVVTQEIQGVEVTHFDGLLVDYVQRYGAHAIIRGLRAISDFEHEFQMALINRKIAKQVETVFLMPSEEYSYLSSTIIKDVATHGGALTEFLHPEVARRLQERIRSLKTSNLLHAQGGSPPPRLWPWPPPQKPWQPAESTSPTFRPGSRTSTRRSR